MFHTLIPLFSFCFSNVILTSCRFCICFRLVLFLISSFPFPLREFGCARQFSVSALLWLRRCYLVGARLRILACCMVSDAFTERKSKGSSWIDVTFRLRKPERSSATDFSFVCHFPAWNVLVSCVPVPNLLKRVCTSCVQCQLFGRRCYLVCAYALVIIALTCFALRFWKGKGPIIGKKKNRVYS